MEMTKVSHRATGFEMAPSIKHTGQLEQMLQTRYRWTHIHMSGRLSGVQGTLQHSNSISASASAESRLDRQDPLIVCEQQLGRLAIRTVFPTHDQ